MFYCALLSAGCTSGRMDLLIAIMQRTTILDVGGQAIHHWRRQCPDRESTVLQGVQERAVGCAERAAEGRRDRAEVRLLRDFDTSLPSLEAIDISWLDGALRMEPTGFTAVFDVDSEDHPLRLGRSAAAEVVGWCDLANA